MDYVEMSPHFTLPARQIWQWNKAHDHRQSGMLDLFVLLWAEQCVFVPARVPRKERHAKQWINYGVARNQLLSSNPSCAVHTLGGLGQVYRFYFHSWGKKRPQGHCVCHATDAFTAHFKIPCTQFAFCQIFHTSLSKKSPKYVLCSFKATLD